MKLTIEQVEAIAKAYVASNKLSNSSFTETHDNIVGLLDKIGKITTKDFDYEDKLLFMDGEDLPLGKTIEEWFEDLTLPEEYDSTGAGALSPHYPTYRKPYYSYTLGRKKFPKSIPNNNIERAVNNTNEAISIVTSIYSKLENSERVWRYSVKREILGKLIAQCESAMATKTVFSKATAYEVDTLLKGDSGVGIVVKPYKANDATDWANAIEKGYIVPLDLVTTIAKPTDEASGEAFIEAVKKDEEIASDISEGHSLSGNTLGRSPSGMILIVKQGVMPNIEVKTLAGAFNKDEVAFPVKVIRVKDFGSANSKVFAMLIDERGARLHNSYRAIRENLNGDGDFLNVFKHSEDTGYISRNTFVRVYEEE